MNLQMNSIFIKLHNILTDQFHFHSDQLEKETKFESELGMDSREMLELLKDVEMTFKIDINLDEIDWLIRKEKLITLQDLVNYIKEKQL